MQDFFNNLGIDVNNLYSEFQALGIVAFLVGAAVCLLFALYGYKLQKLCIAVAAGLGSGSFSLGLLSKFIEDANNVLIFSILIGVVVFIVIYALYIKLVSFAFALAGGAVIYLMFAPDIAAKIVEASGSTAPMLDMIVRVIITVVGAVACGILAKFVFKWCVIVGTSFAGSAGLVACLINIIGFIAEKPINIPFIVEIIVAILLGIVFSVIQIKKNVHTN